MLRMHTDRSPRLPRTLIGLAAVVALFVLADPVFAAEAAESSKAAASATTGGGKSWGAFFGRLHVVVLHLPIGLLIGAFVIEFLGMFRRSRGYDVAAAWLFVLGAASAVVAVISGMLLGLEEAASSAKSGMAPESIFQLLTADTIEQGVSETMGWHMWLGITLMVAAIVAAVLKIMAVRRQWPDDIATPDHGGLPLGVARIALIAAMVALPVAGHLGGNMTHGQKYLFEHAPFDVPESIVNFPEGPSGTTNGPVVTDGEAKPDGTVAAWNTVIQPVLNDSCVRCHGPSKKNGGIQVDSLAETLKSKNEDGLLGYPLLTPRDAQFSALHTVIVLPKSHDLFMPPDEKDYVDLEDAAFIGEWIQNYDGRLEDPEAPKKQDNGTKPEGTDNENGTTASRPLIDPVAIRAIEDVGGSAQSLSQEENPELLTVKFAYLKTLDPEAVAKISNTANQVAWLTFEGSAFSDTAVNQMPALPKLTKLNLKDTQVTDAGLEALPELPSLEWLNLFGTDITDAGLDSLKRYTTLSKLYVTGTNVTEAGVAKLRAALPETKIYSDFDGQFSFAEPEPEPVAGKPINTVCPVSGQPVKEGFVSVFEGKTVGFCCNNCKGKFDANPAPFKDKIKPAPGNAETPEPPKPADPADQQSAKPVNDKCVVSGAPIDAKQFVIYKNKKVAFCCGNCKAKFEKNPEQFAAKIP